MAVSYIAPKTRYRETRGSSARADTGGGGGGTDSSPVAKGSDNDDARMTPRMSCPTMHEMTALRTLGW